jgi:hypothetical protein
MEVVNLKVILNRLAFVFRSAIFLLAICTVSHSVQAEIYKWVDENGKVHFGDKKVRGAKQETVKLAKTSSDWARFDIKVKAEDVFLTESEMRHIVDGVNYVYEFFDKVLYFDIYKSVPVNILVLKDRQTYVNYLTGKSALSAAASYGVYFRDENQIIVYIREDREQTFRTIRHEVSHAIVDTIMPYAPAWINEGLAEQMETINRSSSGLYIESHSINRKSVARAVRRDSLTRITDFLKLPSDKWRHSLGDGKKSLQSHAGQFVYFLLSSPPNRKFVT